MTRITVLGGTGYAGGNIVAEATRRGHHVVSYSRTAPANPLPGVDYRHGDLQDPQVSADAVAGADVLVSALSPRGDLAEQGRLRRLDAGVADRAAAEDVRFIVVGGAGSLQASEGGALVMDGPDFPDEIKLESREMNDVLSDLRARDDSLDWSLVSPAAGFGGFAPGEARGHYRVGGDVLLVDELGESFISGADFALAVVDEIDHPAHQRARFTVAY
ncbi:MAG: NAD(P)-dependent oxidoreductase [Nostocoides sp.]